jgi:glycosyltransferase involved in cell wall biosynthesis
MFGASRKLPDGSFTIMSESILWATAFWDHHGSHSGMAPLSREINLLLPDKIHRVESKPREPYFSDRLTNGIRRLLALPRPDPEWISINKQSPFYGERSWMLEREISELVARSHPSIVLLEAIDEQLFLLAEEKRKWPHTRLVGLCHQPPAWWRLNHARPDIVKALDLLIIVASTARSFWEQFTDKEKVAFIPHGIDSEFFCPLKVKSKLPSGDNPLRAVFSGLWLRDFDTMKSVVSIADDLNLPIRFEMVVPRFSRGSDACYRMAMSPRVNWYSDLVDEELRRVYQESDVLILTLRDSTANNGLLEGMACGLPAIVTDVGGVRDYAKESFADFVRPRDASAVIEILQHYVMQRNKLVERGAAARAHVEKHLSWRKIAGEYAATLRSLF